MNLCVKAGARGSKLSQAQVWEVLDELNKIHPAVTFDPIWVTTMGDKDLKTSLRDMGNCNFFTKEIDEMQLTGQFRISIHSAKDLPDPLASGLSIVALTRGQDPSDSLVCGPNFTGKGKIATSSHRRQAHILELYPEAQMVDIRGTIEQRLSHIHSGEIEGLVVAEAALIRLGLTSLNRQKLSCPVAQFQGQLAVIARSDDEEMAKLFQCLDTR